MIYAAAALFGVIFGGLALIGWLFKRFPKGSLKNELYWKCRYSRVISRNVLFAQIKQPLQDSLRKALSIAEHIDDDGKATVEALRKQLVELETACVGASEALQEIPGYKPFVSNSGDYIIIVT